jgi:hypothetical protein
VARCLSVLKKGDMINSGEFLKKYAGILNQKASAISQLKRASAALGVGIDIGVLRQVELNPISFQDFCKLDTIHYLKEQLRGLQYKNLQPEDPSGLSSTQRTYIYSLYRFNNWLVGKEFEFSKFSQTGSDTFRKIYQKVTLEDWNILSCFIEIQSKTNLIL